MWPGLSDVNLTDYPKLIVHFKCNGTSSWRTGTLFFSSEAKINWIIFYITQIIIIKSLAFWLTHSLPLPTLRKLSISKNFTFKGLFFAKISKECIIMAQTCKPINY